MAAGDTVITVVGNLVDDPELRFTPSGAAVAKFRVASTPRFLDKQTNEWKDGESALPHLHRLAPGGRERRRVAPARHARHRPGPAQAAVVRDQGGREAHRLRDRRRRGRPEPAQRHREGHQDPARRRRRRLRRRRRPADNDPWASAAPAPPAAAAAGGGGGGWNAPRRRLRRAPVLIHRLSPAPPDRLTIPAPRRASSDWSTTMAKPPLRKPKKKVCQFCKDKIDLHRLQGHRPAAEVHLRPRQDPRPPGHRQLHPAPARRRHGRQEQPRDGAAALHQHRALRGATTMKLILTQEVAGLGAPGDVVEVKDGYGRNYLVPRGVAIRWTRGGEKQVASIQRGREVREIRDLDHAKRGQGPARGPDGHAAGPRRRRRSAVRLGHRRPTSSTAVTKAGGPAVDKRRDRDRPADQDRRRPPGHRPAAPRGRRDAVRRGRPAPDPFHAVRRPGTPLGAPGRRASGVRPQRRSVIHTGSVTPGGTDPVSDHCRSGWLSSRP